MSDPAARPEPTYTDPAHPIYRALPIAEALDVLDRRQAPSDVSPAAIAIEALLIEIGEAAGGLSTDGFRTDLIGHVARVERGQADADHDQMVGIFGYYTGSYLEAPPISTGAYRVGVDAAAQWITDVQAALARHGMSFDGRGIVAVASALRVAA